MQFVGQPRVKSNTFFFNFLGTFFCCFTHTLASWTQKFVLKILINLTILTLVQLLGEKDAKEYRTRRSERARANRPRRILSYERQNWTDSKRSQRVSLKLLPAVVAAAAAALTRRAHALLSLAATNPPQLCSISNMCESELVLQFVSFSTS